MASLKTLEVIAPENRLFAYNLHLPIREFPALTSLTVKHHPDALAFRGDLTTHLYISMSGLNQEVVHLRGLLRDCALLERLEIENTRGHDNSLRPDKVTSLPHLHSFMQALNWDHHAAGMIDNLDLPHSCSVILRYIAGLTNGRPSLDPPIFGTHRTSPT